MQKRIAMWVLLGLGALASLSGCGGGGSGGEPTCQVGVSTMLFPFGCDTASTTSSGTVAPSLKLAMTDASGATTNQVSPDRTGTLLATVKDARGSGAPSVAVTFTSSDATASFVPTSGTALTDANGIARIGLAAGTQAGGFTVTASAAVNGAAVSGSAGYAVSVPTLSLSTLAIAPAQLSSGGNASVSVTVSSGGVPYAPPLLVSFTSPCIAAGKATIGSPVLTQSGVAAASYSDKGCGVADVITAKVSLGGATLTQTGTITVLPASAGSIKFVSADTTNIALKGTGGFGRQGYSTLKFEVSDTTGNKVAGKLVDFVFADSNTTQTVGGLSLNPTFATSAADGTVTTLVTAGTIPTSVRVVATIRGSTPPVTTLSDILVASTGLPDQKHFSLSTQIGNCEGRDIDQTCSIVTATLGDHFGNPVPDGTAVNFSTEGGIIDASCVTGSLLSLPPGGLPAGSTPVGQTTNSKVGPGSGTCSVLLRASQPRPPNMRITVLAYAVGEENFFDANGNNSFDAGDTFVDKSPDIFRDDNESKSWTPGEPCIGPNANGQCNTPGDGQYNGVLRIPQVPSAQTLYVSDQLVQTFSGSHATITFNPAEPVCPASGLVDVQVTITDEIGNLMPANSTIAFSSIWGICKTCTVTPDNAKVNNVVLAIGEPMVIPTYVVSAQCLPGDSGKLFATITTPLQIKTTASVSIK